MLSTTFIRKNRLSHSVDISKAEIVEPSKSEKYEEYANAFYELRKNKGMTEEEAKKLVQDPVYYGVLMVKAGEADGWISCSGPCQ